MHTYTFETREAKKLTVVVRAVNITDATALARGLIEDPRTSIKLVKIVG